MTLVLFALLASLAAGLLKFVALSRGADFMTVLKWFLYYLKIHCLHPSSPQCNKKQFLKEK